MKTLVCLTALSLVACVAPFEARQGSPDSSEAGSPDMLVGVGGSAGSNETPQAGKAPMVNPSATGGSDSGMAGSPTGVGGNSPTAGMAGKGSAGSGMAGMPSAGNGNAGSPAMAGTGGSDSPSAGTGGTDSGTAGTTAEPDNCDASGRVGTWTPIEWVSGSGSQACLSQLNRIGKGLLTLDLGQSNGCSWQTDIDSPDSWVGCGFTNTVTCPALGAAQPFTAKVSSNFVGTSGQLGGAVSFDATGGACSNVPSVSFTATRH